MLNKVCTLRGGVSVHGLETMGKCLKGEDTDGAVLDELKALLTKIKTDLDNKQYKVFNSSTTVQLDVSKYEQSNIRLITQYVTLVKEESTETTDKYKVYVIAKKNGIMADTEFHVTHKKKGGPAETVDEVLQAILDAIPDVIVVEGDEVTPEEVDKAIEQILNDSKGDVITEVTKTDTNQFDIKVKQGDEEKVAKMRLQVV